MALSCWPIKDTDIRIMTIMTTDNPILKICQASTDHIRTVLVVIHVFATIELKPVENCDLELGKKVNDSSISR